MILAELIRLWHIKAEHDLQIAKHELTFDDPATDNVCFHAQQVAEKYLKSFLQWKQVPFHKTHSLEILLAACIEIDSKFAEYDNEKIYCLTEYAVEVRYPDEFYFPSREETELAIQLAESIKDFVMQRLYEHHYKI